ncbi:hypothetical protein [Rhizobacter sp. Root1221]|uniref:hypothetical protein n=1 Tax=Rhizobacter sp. Root1221 TaxID=1736433 RepID=UPI000700A975|nr:hypothetical protein [Rhizobacter sp. Root1221]KQV83041.1 hypothetical protein ASC87_08870 [Rhizobacter sp. Root1221]
MSKPKLYVREPDDAARGRGAALTGGALVLALLAGLGWLAAGRGDPPPGDVAAVSRSARQPGGAASAASAPGRVMVPVVLPASPATTLPPGLIEVCAVGLMSQAEWNRPARREAFDAASGVARQGTVTALKASADPLTRGLALAMESSHGGEVAANTAPRDALARLALTSRSPEVYGLAWRVCSTEGAQDTTSACRMLSAEQWARLDPDNAVAWASVYQQASTRRDRAAMTDAQFRMSIARAVDGRAGRLPGIAVAHVPPGTGALETEAVVGEVARFDAIGLADAAKECTSPTARDANRLQLCESMAQVLWQHGRKPADLSTAIQIGEAVGWPAERLQPLRDEAAALSFISAETLREASLSCADVRRRISHFEDAGLLGEVAWARRAIAAAGKPLAYWAAAAEAQRRALVRAEASASAVPAIP